MGINERREKAATTDAVARDLVAKEKVKREARTVKLRAQREARDAAEAKAESKVKKGKRK